jgi:hypothetical protein
VSLVFSQSTRSLQADQGRATLLGMIGAIVLLLLWAAWFFLSSISVYTTGQIVQTTGAGVVGADFPSQTAEGLRTGQTALVRPQGALANQLAAIPAVVTDVEQLANTNAARVELYIRFDDPQVVDAVYQALANGLSGTVEVETERISPAVFLQRAAGKFINTPVAATNTQ